MKNQYLFVIILLIVSHLNSLGQDAALLYMEGTMPATFINPALTLKKNINISLIGINVQAGTDGPSINDITSRNSSGNRYIDVKKITEKLHPHHNITSVADVHTVDLGLKIGTINLMAGHGFRSSANVSYPKGLLEIASKGNASFVGQKVDLGTSFDVLAYNELYLGAQTNLSNFSIGFKGKLLYGAANLKTERSDVLFETKSEFYQLELQTDYLIRSSGLLRYQSLDSITVQYSPFTFDNFFYDNRGLAFDIGATFRIGRKWLLSASALDIGSITWNFFPRKYTSKGTFAFKGVDILDYLGDTTSISLSDTLLELVKVQSSLENYTTRLNSRYTLGFSYDMNDDWSFFGLYMLNRNFGYISSQFTASVLRKFSFFQLGLNYSISENNFTSFGIFGKIIAGPFSAYIQSENIVGWFRPLESKNAGLRLGTTFRF